MTGLEKVINSIQEEAAAEARDLITAAKDKAARLLGDAKAAGEEEAATIAESANAAVLDIGRKTQSSISILRRRLLLERKRELISQTLDAAMEQLRALPVDEYFKLIAKMAAAEAQPGHGKLLLGKRDMQRLPESFKEELAARLPAGCGFDLEAINRDIGGGCILAYGDIEINCSFEAVFYSRKDEFEDIVRQELF